MGIGDWIADKWNGLNFHPVDAINKKIDQFHNWHPIDDAVNGAVKSVENIASKATKSAIATVTEAVNSATAAVTTPAGGQGTGTSNPNNPVGDPLAFTGKDAQSDKEPTTLQKMMKGFTNLFSGGSSSDESPRKPSSFLDGVKELFSGNILGGLMEIGMAILGAIMGVVLGVKNGIGGLLGGLFGGGSSHEQSSQTPEAGQTQGNPSRTQSTSGGHTTPTQEQHWYSPATTWIGNAAETVSSGVSNAWHATSEYVKSTSRKVVSLLKGEGWTDAQATGLAANFVTESKLNPYAVGDGGHAKGIGQWHEDRQALFEKRFGHKIDSRDIPKEQLLKEQVQFASYELNTTEAAAGAKLRATTQAGEAAAVVSRHFERPADRAGEATRRAALAEGMMAGNNGTVVADGTAARVQDKPVAADVSPAAAQEAAAAIRQAMGKDGNVSQVADASSVNTQQHLPSNTNGGGTGRTATVAG